ncbi:MAG: hypothetical protein M5R36_19550 [Deltaproteobacteria bacterium]|nr:hypothetical protein [Deltaproteobacteria bacterium]
MRMRVAPLLALAALLAAQSACFDLEAELRIMPDGSGFLTTWVRVDRRDALVAMAVAGRTLSEEIDDAVAGLREATDAVRGVQFVDEAVYDEADKTVLRYRVLFDNPSAINAFWKSERARRIPIAVAATQLDFQSGGGACGTFLTAWKSEPRTAAALFPASDPMLEAMDQEAYGAFLDKMLSGNFRLRIVVPGDVKAHDAPARELLGYPLYRMTAREFFEAGLTARVKSEIPCGKEAEQKEVPAATLGPVPSADEVEAVVDALPLLLRTTLEFKQTGRHEATYKVAVEVNSELKEVSEFHLSLLLSAFPNLGAHAAWKAEPRPGGRYRYVYASEEPVDFREGRHPMIFIGRDGGKDVFRMRLAPYPAAKNRAPDAPARHVLTVSVELRDDITTTNAQEHDGKKAVWRLDDKTLTRPVTLEALAP